MDKYKEIVRVLKSELGSRGHDLDHIERVYNTAVNIGHKYSEEEINMEVLEIAAILHDIGRKREGEDVTGKMDHAIIGANMAKEILEDLGYTKEVSEHVSECIKTHRFRNDNKPESLEAKILFDADKLDSIGAIGIGRCFYVSSQFNQMMFNDMNFEEYKEINIYDGKKLKNRKLHSPNMEYEFKLKKISERLFTEEAKKIAARRNKFMKEFFERMRNEVQGVE